ncbi:hypothetical protein EST38_g11247 [Candolleomyces aberdarensis]|uniref:Uncharacterized protein n=1 Tax=Candolleomyces aberdarensis TaxID=2316362 RepID=A0A4Q2D601_9AGAR|nr:hypothetical protein EST38_g11247 [Candolleomyces aberdarensis]
MPTTSLKLLDVRAPSISTASPDLAQQTDSRVVYRENVSRGELRRLEREVLSEALSFNAVPSPVLCSDRSNGAFSTLTGNFGYCEISSHDVRQSELKAETKTSFLDRGVSTAASVTTTSSSVTTEKDSESMTIDYVANTLGVHHTQL